MTASSGDCGYLNEACPGERQGAEFPADSGNVVAVGGTSLSDRRGTWTSTAWREGGSGCSKLFAAPPWQSAVANFSATGCGTDRAIADVAAIGNPNTGVNVYDSTPEGGGTPTGWGCGEGPLSPRRSSPPSSPSRAAPRASKTPPARCTPTPAKRAPSTTSSSGRNGSCAGASICRAGPGYDGPTGLGSPVGLGAFSASG